MNISLGIDVGAARVKLALLFDTQPPAELADTKLLHRVEVPANSNLAAFVTTPRRNQGAPLDTVRQLLSELSDLLPQHDICHVAITGSGGHLVAEALGTPTCNEFQACCRAVDLLHPQARTVFELGGETSRYLRLEPDPGSGTLGIVDYSTNGDCAAGTGAFIDQQASRLGYAVEDIGNIVAKADRAAQIAGRCSVFAKSDMIHAQQKGFQPPEVLRGLCNAVATNYKAAVIKGRAPVPPVVLLGGVSANSAVVASLREVFNLSEDELIVPPTADSLPAIGAARAAREIDTTNTPLPDRLTALGASAQHAGRTFPRMQPLTLDNVTLLRDQTRAYNFPTDGKRVDAYLGLDIGSVGTKLVLIDDAGDVIFSIFTRTAGRPIEVITRCLRETEEAVGWGIHVRAVGTTGSGRELIGELVGADSINDEITAHKTGATFVGDRLLSQRPDTIFEIGGQDSKYIRIENVPAEPSAKQPETGVTTTPDTTPPAESIVVDFTMNEACAAGTGSFLEERAEELGVSIKNEFADLALQSRAPLKLGERCTVFMERDVNTCMQRGASREDVIAGLAYSIAYNYINRVVRSRPIGDCVFFQGGTAYNDAVAAAFSIITNKRIIVPPHNAILGAIGAALLAREKVSSTGATTRFRGYNIANVNYTLREFTCQGCGNHCAIQEFDVEGEKTFWGDKCSDRFRKQRRTPCKPVIPDLVARRHELLSAEEMPDPPQPRATVGIPLALYAWDWLPMWRRFLRECGCAVVTSSETNQHTVRMGLDCVVAEPCFPIIVAHGHVRELVERNVDYLWMPNLLQVAERKDRLNSYVCPWGSTLPFIIRQAPAFRSWQSRILCPSVTYEHGEKEARRALERSVVDLGVPRRVARRAYDIAAAVQQRFTQRYAQAGREALETLLQSNEPGMVLVGRPYNTHDAGVSLAVARKLRDQYGVNVLPVDALPIDNIDIDEVNNNMYWAYGRRILAAGRLVSRHPNLHIIYVTNFKCGPDSFIKTFIRPASNKPFLTLQFDGHSNDAGMMTRCEAYLDSKGILRWWRTYSSKPTNQVSPDERSTSPKCRTPVPG